VIVRAVAELPPGAGRAFLFNKGQMFGVTLSEDRAHGVAVVLLQSGRYGTASLEDVARGAADLEPFQVES
jgi:hypothetical protein